MQIKVSSYSISMSIRSNIIEFYNYRNVLRSLVTKGLFGKYKNSHLGFAWHFVNPMIYLFLCYVMFVELNERSMDNYWVFLTTGIFAFHFLTSSVSGGAGCFVNNASLLKKIYFPKEITVWSQAIINIFIGFVGYAVVITIMAISGYHINPMALLYLPILFALMFFFSIGSMLFLSSVAVYVRDVMYFLSSTQITFFVCTPIRYLATDTAGIMSTIVWMNPFTYYIESFHEILYVGTAPDISLILISAMISIIVFFIGVVTFHYLKSGFVERL